MYFDSEISFVKGFIIKDSLNLMKWVISPDLTKKILDYTCQLAKTNYHGRDYEAYFCKEISISDGPWKFSGLPGAILEISDTENRIKYQATEVIVNQNSKVISPTINITNSILWKDAVAIGKIKYNYYKSKLENTPDISVNKDFSNKIEILDFNELVAPFKVNYKVWVDLEEVIDNKKINESSIPSDFILVENVYKSQYNFMDKVINTDEKSYGRIISSGTLFKDYKENLLLEERDLYGKKFIIQDNIPKFNWEVNFSKRKKIFGYETIEAKFEYKNISVLAYFTPYINSINGPDRYGRLPGLIIYLIESINHDENTKEVKHYLIDKFKYLNSNFEITKPTKGKKVSIKEFDAIYDDINKKHMEMIGTGVDTSD